MGTIEVTAEIFSLIFHNNLKSLGSQMVGNLELYKHISII